MRRWWPILLLVSPLWGEDTIDGDDFSYEGCFEIPIAMEVADIAFYPDGDSGGGGDGYSGSLYVMSSGASGNEQVAEISIPAPSVQATVANCPDATTLRSLTTVGCNLDTMQNEATAGGIAYYDDSGGAGEKLYWTIYEYYNAESTNHDSAGRMDMDLTGCQGAWGMTGTGGEDTDSNSAPYHSHQWEDFLFPVYDTSWADTHLSSRYLIYGRHKEAGCCGGATGINLYAAAPWDDGNPIANNGDMSGQIMLAYPGTWDLTVSHYFPAIGSDVSYRPTDRFSGGAWVRAGTTDAIVITGRKAQGPNWYGFGGDGCNTNQGYHADPNDPRWWFIDPSDLECVIADTCDSWSPTPYATYDPSGETYDDSCFNDTEWQGGAAYDDTDDVFYFAETTWTGVDFLPVVHVYSVTEPAGASQATRGAVSSGVTVSGAAKD